MGDRVLVGALVEGAWVSVERMVWGRGVNLEGGFREELQFVALWPVFLQRKQRPFLIHLARSVGVSFERVTASTSIASDSLWFLGVLENEEGGIHPFFSARIRIFWAWNVFACSTHLIRVVGGEDIDRIMVVSWLSRPTENWSHRVRSSEI
jgi:hypothetical protein